MSMENKGSWLLALDLAGPLGLVVLEGPGVLNHCSWEGGEGARLLFSAAAGLLDQAGIKAGDLGLLGVGRGPGSFTGIRMGIMAAKALAEVLGVQLVAPDSLAAAAVGPEGSENVFVALDARRGELYSALFRMEAREKGAFSFPRLVAGPQVRGPRETARFLAERSAELEGELLLLGSGISAYPHLWPRDARRAERRGPDPAGLAWLCRELHRRGEVEDHLSLVPLYLRKPDVGEVKNA